MPHVEIPQAEIKVVILGDSHIGKTSLVTRFSEGYYRENSRPATIGAFFVTKRITVTTYQNTPAKIQIWDTAGQDNFRAMAPMFYKDAAAVIVCYDVTSRESFEGMRRWLDEVRKKKNKGMEEEDMIVAIAALKTDLLQEGSNNRNGKKKRMVPEHEVEQFAEALGVMYLPTSAKTNRNVNALFQCVADRVLQMRSTTNSMGSNDNNNNTNNNIGATDDNNATTTTTMGGIGNNHHHHDNNTNNPNHNNNTNNAQGGVDTSQMASPRRFDKYYVSQTKDETNDKHHPNHTDHNDYNINNAQTTSKETTIRPHESRSSSRRKSSSNRNKNSGRSTPSTEEGTTAEEDSHPLLVNKKKNMKEKEAGEENGGYCQAVSCGAVDGGSGCVVQ